MTAASELFRSAFEREPEGVWAAPGRVNLIGEHTDYNRGLVLPFALAERTEAAISRRNDGVIRICSAQKPNQSIEITVDALAPGRPAGWGAYVAGVPWALGTASGFDIAVDSTVPVGSGLSSSSALICAVGLGINDLLGLNLTRRELARRTRVTENDYVGAPTGGMDQMASLLCTAGHALLYDIGGDTTAQIPFDPAAVGLDVLVTDTKVHHAHAGGEYVGRRGECERAAAVLGVSSLRDIAGTNLDAALARLGDDRLRKRTRHVVTENQRVLDTADALRAGDWARVGALLIEAHASIRDDFQASCAELDLAVDTLVGAGALGARMTGGGFGGAALSLVPIEEVERARDDVDSAFAARGFAAPHSFSVTPSAGAQRIA